MNRIISFIEGQISYHDFCKLWNSNHELQNQLECLVDFRNSSPEFWSSLPYQEHRMAIYKHYNGSVLRYLQSEPNAFNPDTATAQLRFAVHSAIASIVLIKYPFLKLTPVYKKEADFEDAVIGDWFGGKEVDEFIATLLKNFPATMKPSNRKNLAKRKIRESFHVEGNRLPHWAQEPQWPMGEKSPMKFLQQKRSGDQVLFTFQDVDSKITVTIEQFY